MTRRYLNRHFTNEVKGGVDSWIGFTVDELRRVRTPIGKWQNRYPLIELRMSRPDCIRYVEKYGLPTPPKSACWMCPNRRNEEWQDMKESMPETFKMAVDFERELRRKDPHLWLHQSGVPLDEADFLQGDRNLSLFCENGTCFT